MSLLARWQSRSSDPEARKRAAAKLGVPGNEKAVATLATMLDDPEPSVRLAAAEALGQTGHAAAVGPLLSAIRNAAGLPDATAATFRSTVVAALSRAGRNSVPVLLEALAGKDQRVREAVVEALGGIESPETLPALKAALGDDRSAVRQAAARGLGRTASAESAAALVAALKHRDSATRRAVVEALAGVGAAAGVIPALSSALADQDRAVRGEALRSLGCIASQEAFTALLAACSGPDRELRQGAGELVKTLTWQPSDPRDRAKAAIIRGNYAGAATMGPCALEPLIVALGDRDVAVRRAAAEAIALTHDAGAARALAGALGDRDESVRSAAAQTLAQLGPASAGPVIDLLDDESPAVSSTAGAVLCEMGESQVIAHLMTTMPGADGARDEGARQVTVETTDDIDHARVVLATLEPALRHLVKRIDPRTLTAVASVYDIVRLETANLRGRHLTGEVEELVSLADLRTVAANELRRRGLDAPHV